MMFIIAAVAFVFLAVAIHWRRFRRSARGALRGISAAWHRATEHRFERLTTSAEAADALHKLASSPELKFSRQLGRVDDEMGGFLGAADFTRRSVAMQRFSLWELERYCAALRPDDAVLYVGDEVAQRYAVDFLPAIDRTRLDAEARVAHVVANERAVTSQDVVSKQLWVAAASAVASAVAAIASIVAALPK